MKIKHKVPTLVSMWMLDVFCCAFGCVSLLFLVHSRQANDKAQEYQEALTNHQKLLDYANDEKNALLIHLMQLQDEKDILQSKYDQSIDELARRNRENEQLTRLLDDQKKNEKQLQSSLSQREAELRSLYRSLQAEQAQVAELKDRIARLENQVGRLQAFIVDLHRESERRVIQLQKRLDNRFGGIEIAGRNVVFIVDISGSMSKKDTNTPDPTKWPMVIDTVCNFMNDARMMEQYQVIVFSSSARWLFNDNGAWRTFRGEESIKEVRKALSEINPFDDTNLYAAFNLAFKLRSQGLDTIYLFSDGLPTTGPGLTREDEMRQPALSEIERNDKLGRYVLDTLSREWNQPLGPEGQRVRIHAVGFYFDSPALGAFLWNLARQNGGTFVGMSKP